MNSIDVNLIHTQHPKSIRTLSPIGGLDILHLIIDCLIIDKKRSD